MDQSKQTVLVTGGAGYAGSILLRRLLRSGYRVVCVDCLRYGNASLEEIWDDPDFRFHKVDINYFPSVEAIFGQYKLDSIVHLAAIVGDPACQLEPGLASRTNLDASINLLENAKKYRIPRFMFASTCSNYGKMNCSTGFVDENSPLQPVSLYAELKVAFEHTLIDQQNRVKGFCPTILRFSTLYGVSPRMRFDLTVNEFTKQLALRRELVVYGENYWRPYCHVSDFSAAILAVLSAPEDVVAYNIFNVGDTTQNYTKKMLVDELLEILPAAKVKFVPAGEDPRNYRVSFTKIQDLLGFRITKTVPDGMQQVLSVLRSGNIDNPDDPIFYNIPITQVKTKEIIQ